MFDDASTTLRKLHRSRNNRFSRRRWRRTKRGGRRGGASPPVILGNGEYRYQVVGNWGELPPGYTYGDSAAVCVDSKDNVYVFTRGSHPVIVFDRNGKFLRSWGEDIGFTNAHGAAVGPDDMLYLTDDFGHAVRKCTDGRQGCADNRNT